MNYVIVLQPAETENPL